MRSRTTVLRAVRVLAVAMAMVLSVALVALAASTVSWDAAVNAASSVTGQVDLDAGATVGTGHTYQVDGGTAQALTVAGDGTYSISVASLADGMHTLSVSIMVDPDGVGAAAAAAVTGSTTVTVEGGVLAAMLNLNFDVSQIWPYTQTIWDALKPLVYLGAGVGLGFMIVRYVRQVF